MWRAGGSADTMVKRGPRTQEELLWATAVLDVCGQGSHLWAVVGLGHLDWVHNLQTPQGRGHLPNARKI